jgi:hypothetical protein
MAKVKKIVYSLPFLFPVFEIFQLQTACRFQTTDSKGFTKSISISMITEDAISDLPSFITFTPLNCSYDI